MLAELGLGLAGFAGVAAALGGRSREYGSTDLIRLMILFYCAGSVVAGSLAIFTLASYGLEDTTNYLIISGALALFFVAAVAPLWLASYRNVSDPKSGAPTWVLIVGTVFFVIVEALYVLNLFKGGESGPLISAFSLSLVYGLWMFTRLMVSPK